MKMFEMKEVWNVYYESQYTSLNHYEVGGGGGTYPMIDEYVLVCWGKMDIAIS